MMKTNAERKYIGIGKRLADVVAATLSCKK